MTTRPVGEPTARGPSADPDLTASDWQQVFALLDDALDLEADALPAWLAALDPSKGRYATEVRKLLDDRGAVDRSGFLQTPPRLVATGPRPRDDRDKDASRVGPYRLLREIGRGGTAVVWLAERVDGTLHRQVALKRPDIAFHGPGHAERLARERDILSSLAHPHIARIDDAGIEEDGRPFLAMDYIDGRPIDVFVREHSAPIERRVALIVDVARAVAYAHTRHVVHRDLKPSNILVDVHGRPHLVDFGIAKLIDDSALATGDDTQHTIALARALTPHYASPEQLRGDAVGMPSDIYSLGVVAFELLTGARPYRLATGLGAFALAEAVVHARIPMASTTVDDPATRRALRGDLDAIVARMLAKDPGARYATMDAVADDLDRHLRGERVQVRGETWRDRARGWLRRHPIESAVVAAVVVALVGGAHAQLAVGLALGLGAVVALWQRNASRREAERARVALQRGDQVKNFVVSILTHAVPGAGRDGGVSATDLLQVAARRLDADLVGQPAVAAELAAHIGDGFNELGDFKAARAWLPKAIERCDREFGPQHPWTLRARRRLVEAANMVGDLRTSGTQLPGLLRDLRAAHPPQPRLFVQALQSHAFVLTKQDRDAEAFAALDEAVSVATAELGTQDATTLTALASWSNTLLHFGRSRDALAAIEPALAPAYAAFGDERPHPVLTLVERNYADALTQNQRPRDATVVLRQTLADQTALDGGETPRVRYGLFMLARALLFRGCVAEPLALLTHAAALDERGGDGISDDAISLAAWLALAQVEAGDAEGALARLSMVEAAGRAAGLAQQGSVRVVRALAEARAGRDDDAKATLDSAVVEISRESATVRLRAERIRVAVARRSDPAHALSMARAALAQIDPQVAALEHGWLLVEAARASGLLDDRAGAAELYRRAIDVWKAGQVDAPELHDGLRDEFADALSP